MKYDLSEFFDRDEKLVISFFQKHGGTLTLVGGAVRDYLFSMVKSHDLDFEFRSNSLSDLKTIVDKFIFENEGKIEVLPYQVVRLKFRSKIFEFSYPRIEKIVKPHFHHYFEVELVSNLSYKESMKRRDITINALGFEVHEDFSATLIDPFKGFEDGTNQIVRAVSSDFNVDPVRFVRAFRFKHYYGYEIAEETKYLLSIMNLKQLTLFYFIEEWVKSQKLSFLKDVVDFINLNPSVERPSFYAEINEVSTHYDVLVKKFETIFSKADFFDLGFFLAVGFNLSASTQRHFFSFSESDIRLFQKLREDLPLYVQGEFSLENGEYVSFLRELQNRLDALKKFEREIHLFFRSKFPIELKLVNKLEIKLNNITEEDKKIRDALIPELRSICFLSQVYKTIMESK